MFERVVKGCDKSGYQGRGQQSMTKTIDYYNQNAETFAAGTVSVDFRVMQEKFLSYLPKGALILDFGCGSGRDTKFFGESGYLVEATDGSAKMCEAAGRYTGVPVKQMLFQDLDERDKYDGIWACSSILHLPYRELLPVMDKMTDALRQRGIIYTSFKYGTYEGERNGRYFTDMTEKIFAGLLEETGRLGIREQWVTPDVRPGRETQQWLNLILQKS